VHCLPKRRRRRRRCWRLGVQVPFRFTNTHDTARTQTRDATAASDLYYNITLSINHKVKYISTACTHSDYNDCDNINTIFL